MCLRALGYFGYRSAATLTAEEQVDHARALLYPEYASQFPSIVRAGIMYSQVNLDGSLTNVEARCGNAMTSIGGSEIVFTTQAVLDKCLNNGLPVILGGYLTYSWSNQFVPYGHWGWQDGKTPYHYIAVTGRTSSGLYVVNDPYYQYGAMQLSYSQLLKFNYSTLSGRALVWQTPMPCVIMKTSNFRAYAFMRKTDNNLIYRCMQSAANGGWGQWAPISSTPVSGNPVVVEQPCGLLLLFVRGTAGQILKFAEDAYGNMSGCEDFGGETYYPLSTCKNQDGRVEMYARGIEGNLYRRAQTAVNGGFGGWEYIIGNSRTGSGAALDRNGRIELFAGLDVNADSTNLGRVTQVAPNGGYPAKWQNLEGHLKYSPVVFMAPDSSLFTAVRSVTENILYYKTERDNWYSWAPAGKTWLEVVGQPQGARMLYRESNGITYTDLTFFVRAKSNVINWASYRNRNGVYDWTSWNGNIEGIAASDPAVGRYGDGRTFVVVRGTTRYLYIRLQNGSFTGWDSWQVLGNELVF
jgi:hypothetical protein